MTAAHPLRSPNVAWFAAAALLVYAAAAAIVRSAGFAARPDLLAGGVAADLTITVPALFWWLLVRPGNLSWRSMLAVVAVSVLGARLVLPAHHRSFVGLVRYATAPVELGLLGWAVVHVRRSLLRARGTGAAADLAETLERALAAALGDRAPARILAAEAATLYYALGGGRSTWARQPTTAFSHHGGRSSAMLLGISMAVLVEAGVVHLVLARSHPAAAWGATLLSAYSVLWLAGHFRAVACRRTVLEHNALTIRVGLRLTARLPIDAVASVERATWRTQPPRCREWLDAARPVPANVLLRLRAPTSVTTVLGLRRTVTGIAVHLDEPDRFAHALRAVIGQSVPAGRGAPEEA